MEMKNETNCYYQRPQPCYKAYPLDPDHWCRPCSVIMNYHPPQGAGGQVTHQQYYDNFVKKLKNDT